MTPNYNAKGAISALQKSYGSIEAQRQGRHQLDDAAAMGESDSQSLTLPLVSQHLSNSNKFNKLPYHPQSPSRVSSDLRPPIGRGKATILSEVFNISKNLIGGGVLSLSGGIALFANDPHASLSAIVWVVILGAVFAYFCLLIGKSCQMTQSSSYRDCWERTVGKRGATFVSIVNILDPLLGIYANASILSQSLQMLLEGVDVYWSVQTCLLVITLVAILPLCLMKHLNALAPFSAIGMVGVLCALLAMTVRLWDGSYTPGGEYYEDIPTTMRPQFGTASRPWSTAALPYVCMVYTSFDMHYNSPTFYAELRNASISRYGWTVGIAFGVTAVFYFSIAVVGFLTFGEHADSYILNNYSPVDPLATISRLAIGLCSLASYPLNYIGVRDNIIEILGLTDTIDTYAKLCGFTIILLSLLTFTELFITDLGLINSVGGGTTVTLICFVLPAIMFRGGILQQGIHTTIQEHREVWLVMTLMVMGALLGVTGVWDSILTE